MKELYQKIQLEEFLTEVEKLDKNAPDFKKQFQDLLSRYVEKLENVLLKESLSFRVAAIDFINNINGNISVKLAERNNPEILKAYLALEKIKGIEASEIRDNLKDVETITSLIYLGKIHEDRGFQALDCENKIHIILNKYLQQFTDVNNLQDEYLKEFYKDFETVSEIIFGSINNPFMPPRNKFVEALFENDIDQNTINNIYNNILKKHPILSSFDYSEIITNNLDHLYQIKGFYREMSDELFDTLFSSIEDDQSFFNEYDEFFKEIIAINSDDEEGLKWLFKEVDKRIINNQPFRNFLEQKDYYQKYANINIENTYIENLNKFLAGNSDIDEAIINDIGRYNGFINKFPELLKLFIESKDDKYKRKLILPLVVALIEIQKRKYNLDFKNVFTNKNANMKVFGYYEHKENVMYISPIVFDQAYNLDLALIYSFDTVFHETRHACQYREIEESNDFNYDNLIMAIDVLLRGKSIGDYYQTNYEHISYERDAREVAYVDCMTIFEEYPEMQKLVKESYRTGNYSLSNYMRKETFVGEDTYFGIINQFLDSYNMSLKDKKEQKYHEYIVNELKKYPVIMQFFEFNDDTTEIRIRNIEELKRIKEEAKKDPTNEKNKKILYSIQAFVYALQVGQFIKSKEEYRYEDLNDEGYNESVIKEVIDNVGKGPTM